MNTLLLVLALIMLVVSITQFMRIRVLKKENTDSDYVLSELLSSLKDEARLTKNRKQKIYYYHKRINLLEEKLHKL